MLSIFALVGLQLYHGKLLRKCIKEMTSVEQRLADSAAKRAFNDNPGHYEQFFVRIALLALPMRQGLCNGRASVRPSARLSVCLWRRWQPPFDLHLPPTPEHISE